MTTHLLPSGPSRRDLTEPADDHGSSPVGRWVLHRAGILNVWQYDRVELRFAGGRLLLRGKNGAGKSKALEILLPFLLDGDTRALDATGRDRTTVRWLMTEGRSNGNHVGYVWLELRCIGDDGAETFQTLGAGLKASTAAGRADSWFFLTHRRVGVDLDLDVAGECLSIERLKQALGDDAVTASGAEHRRRVGRHVFGLFDEARYRNLLHLLHSLRDPNIGNQVEAGELARVLSAALPPIDERVLTEAAGHFDDLEAIRDQVDRSARTALALGQFLGYYRRYTRTVLSRRAVAVEQAEVSRARAVRAARQLGRAVDEAASAAARAEVALAAHRRERTDREAERRELERSEGYRAHQDLVDRQERVAALEMAAGTAESAADRAEAAHRRAIADLTGAGDDVRRSLLATGQAATTVAGLAAESGLEPALLGPPPATGAEGEVDSAGLVVADERARSARTLVDGRRHRAGEVRDLAQQAERAEQEAAVADERAASSEAEVDQERTLVAEARSARVASEQAWAGAVAAWTTSGSPSTFGVAWHPVYTALTVDRQETTWVAAVRRAVGEALVQPLREARQVAAEADLAEARATESLVATEARLADIEAQSEARPGASRFRYAQRDPAAGAPFYELVDLAERVSPDDAAGLEAALEAAGLLDAWVSADGLVVHPGTHDTLLHVGGMSFPAGSATLADVLVPAALDGSPVCSETVDALLRSVGLDDQPGVASWVSVGGRWALGVARGAWHKDRVEFVGAGARRATRDRLLDELRTEVAQFRAEVAEAGAWAMAAAHRRDALEGLPVTLPSADAIDEAERGVRTAERTLAAARARHDADRRRAEHARATANRLAAVVAHEALGDSFPVTVDALDRLLSALAELCGALADHRRALHDLTREAERLGTRRREEADRRAEAAMTVAEAGQRRADHDVAAHELATLRQALAATVDAVLAHHADVSARLAELEQSLLPAADRARRQADAEQATAAARLEEARIVEDRARSTLVDAGEALGAAVALPGVLLAATGLDLQELDGVDPPGDSIDRAPTSPALAAAVAPLVDGDDEVSDSMILSRYDRLSEALPGGYDTAIDEHDGVKVVHVADDSGRQTLAVVAARLADEAQAARGRLAAREREVLERFLLRELADEVRSKLLDALDLVAGANRTLSGVSTSHGKGAHLDWKLRDDAAAPAGVAARLLVDELRDEAADAELRDTLLALIHAERAADPSAGYEQHLRAALDYRGWHRFTVKVTDSAHPGSSRILSSRLGLSQGEQRVLSYLALFAAAASHFEAIARDTPTAPRLLLLDDAFAKVD
ncbi:MAG: hypothetical protein QOD63_2257, partial [Actinomycetota bacterium]|nr:hypothetical protein [Actinomycetota bacterium]